MTQPNSDIDKRIKELEILLAKKEMILVKKIENAAELLKENLRLEKNLEQAEKQIDALKRCYRRLSGEKKIKCNRENAMAVYGEVGALESD